MNFEDGFYWVLPNDAKFDMSKVPALENVGDLAADYEFVKNAAQDLDQAVPLLLKHVAPLLAVLAPRCPVFVDFKMAFEAAMHPLSGDKVGHNHIWVGGFKPEVQHLAGR